MLVAALVLTLMIVQASDNLTVDMTQYYDLKPDPNGSDNHT